MNRLSLIPALLASLFTISACSEAPSSASDNVNVAAESQTSSLLPKMAMSPAAIKTLLEEKLPGIEIGSVDPSPKEGIYQVFYNGQMLYVSDDGNFLFTGNLLGLSEERPINLTEEAIMAKAAELAPERAETIAAIKEQDMVVFKAKEEKHAITVFTDVDCAYCRKLHKEVPELNKKGITVKYLAFPRAGVGSSAYDKLVSVWCADDKQLAMDNAKLKRQFSDKSCDNPIADQYQLTRKLGLSGTPALILSDGELISGYVPHADLFKHLESKVESSKASPTNSAGL